MDRSGKDTVPLVEVTTLPEIAVGVIEVTPSALTRVSVTVTLSPVVILFEKLSRISNETAGDIVDAVATLLGPCTGCITEGKFEVTVKALEIIVLRPVPENLKR
jgi:hypothetical protein